MDNEVRKHLLELGFKANNRGFYYLCDIIQFGIDGINILPLKYVGYELIASKYNKNFETIDKSIQSAISNAWLRGNVEFLYSIFGETINKNSGKPSNKQFIMQTISTILDKKS